MFSFFTYNYRLLIYLLLVYLLLVYFCLYFTFIYILVQVQVSQILYIIHHWTFLVLLWPTNFFFWKRSIWVSKKRRILCRFQICWCRLSELVFLKSLWGLGTEAEFIPWNRFLCVINVLKYGFLLYIGWRNSFLRRRIDSLAPQTF